MVLAGGRSSRFGSDKLEALVGGAPMLHAAIASLRDLCAEIVVAAAPGQDRALPDGVRLVHDREPFEGPLAAVAAALEAVRTEHALVLAGDMPFGIQEVYREMLRVAEEAPVDAVALRDGERFRPLPSVVRVAPASTNARALLGAGERRLGALLESLRTAAIDEGTWTALDPDRATLRDVDAPDDLWTPRGRSHVASGLVGRFGVSVVCEGWAPLPLADECPGRVVDWAAEAARHPGSVTPDGDAWPWHVHAFVVETPSATCVIDTGVGASGPYRPWAEHHDDAWAGLDPAGVDHVILTHLHADHAGGAMAGGAPRFPNATYHVHPADWAAFEGSTDYVARDALIPIDEAGHLVLDPEDVEVVPGIGLRHAPGHTPGHRSVVVRDGEDALLLTGDLLHLPIQVAHPDWDSEHDDDPGEGARSRARLLEDARREGWSVAAGHFAHPFGAVGPSGWVSAQVG